ncbi:MAG: hypothetical protein ACJA1E_000555 [Paracoccaceae bacterium]|jgi:hypothetical protein
MMNEANLLILLIVTLTPLVFTVWAILAAVGALKRIAAALEALSHGPTPNPSRARLTKDREPILRYGPK